MADMDREELIEKLEGLRPEIQKLFRQFGMHEPDWGPLELVFGCFMFMGYCDGIRLYKHSYTRRYLNLDQHGRAYKYLGERRGYKRIPLEEGIANAFDMAEQLCWPLWTEDGTELPNDSLGELGWSTIRYSGVDGDSGDD